MGWWGCWVDVHGGLVVVWTWLHVVARLLGLLGCHTSEHAQLIYCLIACIERVHVTYQSITPH